MKAIIESYVYERGIPRDMNSIRKPRGLSMDHLPKVWLTLKVDNIITFRHNLCYLLSQKSKGHTVDEKFAKEICDQLIGEQVEVRRDGTGQYYVSPDSIEELVTSKL
ncbi:hypothetical protein IKG73_01640 [Candidatus Saccharibacteria bacterium]|nr:hypothetical protein [Candidatus Saccharibacteria bacterium]